MMRRVVAVVMASVAAPYIIAFFLSLQILFKEAPGVRDWLDLIKFLPLGTVALIIYGLPTLVLASILAFILEKSGCRARWHAVLSGSVLGIIFMKILFRSEPSDQWLFLSGAALSGAICGWIYWVIATGGRRKAPIA